MSLPRPCVDWTCPVLDVFLRRRKIGTRISFPTTQTATLWVLAHGRRLFYFLIFFFCRGGGGGVVPFPVRRVPPFPAVINSLTSTVGRHYPRTFNSLTSVCRGFSSAAQCLSRLDTHPAYFVVGRGLQVVTLNFNVTTKSLLWISVPRRDPTTRPGPLPETPVDPEVYKGFGVPASFPGGEPTETRNRTGGVPTTTQTKPKHQTFPV